MILPDKHLDVNRTLLGVGADVLKILDHPSTTGELWDRFLDVRKREVADQPVSFDWFAKAITFLFAIRAIRIQDGLLEIEGSA